MSFTSDEVKRTAALKEWIESRIAELEEEIAKLKEALAVVDAVLKKTSFQSASELVQPVEAPRVKAEETLPREVARAEVQEVKTIKRSKNGQILASAFISKKGVTIIPASEVKLYSSIPPFRSFLVNRILEGMRSKDLESSKQGKLDAQEVFTYVVEEEPGGLIKKIEVTNYREKNRLNEIISTSTWAFTRMLEKKAS